jgi:hypothetical protein
MSWPWAFAGMPPVVVFSGGRGAGAQAHRQLIAALGRVFASDFLRVERSYSSQLERAHSAFEGQFALEGPRKIAVAGSRGHFWGEQHRIETRTKRNHS